jgi:hypothetical protein
VEEGRVTRAGGTIRVALAFAALLSSLSLVVWRQSRASEVLRELDELRSARAVAESERAALSARIQGVVEERWGMRVPASGEMVTLLRPAPRAGDGRLAAAEGGR